MIKRILSISLSVTLLLFASCSNRQQLVERTMAGYTMGTTYHIKYISSSDEDLQPRLDSIYDAVVKSMSTYVPSSDIGKINAGDTTVVVDHMFREVYNASKQIWHETGGLFDPTIGIMVNAWGFGPKGKLKDLDDNKVSELMLSVGMEKTRILDNGLFVKENKDTQIDFNAIAKGYTLDRVALFFDHIGVGDYLIEIGGEIVAKGKKINGDQWVIGIDDPDQSSYGNRPLTAILTITDKAMATSGNYRNYRIDSLTGEKFVHTIDATTGYTSRSNMLSATVIAKNCTYADGYATAFMAMGLERTKEFLVDHSDIDAYLIYVDDEGNWQKFMTAYFEEHLVE